MRAAVVSSRLIADCPTHIMSATHLLDAAEHGGVCACRRRNLLAREDRTYRVTMVVTVQDNEPDNPEHEFEVVRLAIEEAKQQLQRWEQGETVEPEVEGVV